MLLLGAGIVLNGLAGAMYIGSQFGAGPRDGLMTGLVRRTGLSVRLVRTSLESSWSSVIGWLLGGVIGVGTVLYAVLIGPIVHVLLPRLTVDLEEPAAGTGVRAAGPESRARGAGVRAGPGSERPAVSTGSAPAGCPVRRHAPDATTCHEDEQGVGVSALGRGPPPPPPRPGGPRRHGFQAPRWSVAP